MTVRLEDAASYLCELSDWKPSNLEIQKILYMADMNFAGQTGERLLDEDFEAWDLGPVIPSLYHECKAFGSKRVPDIFWNARDISGTPEAEMLQMAWGHLKSDSPSALIRNTHWSGGAWAARYVPGARGMKITINDMIDEYGKRKRRPRQRRRERRA